MSPTTYASDISCGNVQIMGGAGAMRVYTTGVTPKRHMTSGRAAEAVRLYLPPMLVSIVALPIFAAEAPERKVYAHYMGCWPAQKCLSEQ